MDCNGCTLCCYLLPVPSLNKGPSEKCKHMKEGVGCEIYDERPEECRQFKCSYLQAENPLSELRPDNCGVVFEKVNEKIHVGTKHDSTEINDVVMEQIKQFNRQGVSVIINSKERRTEIFLTEDMNKEKLIKIMDERHGKKAH